MIGFRKLFILFLMVASSACFAASNYFEAIQPVGDEGVLYIYRPKVKGVLIQPYRRSYPDLILDGKSIDVLKFNTHRAVRIKAGEHTLRVTGLTKKANWEPRDKELTFKIVPGQIKYLKLNIQYGDRGGFDERVIYITPIEPEDAIYEIRDTDEAEYHLK
ncbi:MAG: hypothetical protein DRP42_08030 [Tenericutes bacterium]|nr:MAG: hypothetical protein DRP42_08030 [Mycoplasmatota bacterium]